MPQRRTKGSGSIRERSTDRWEIRYEAPPDENGVRRRVYESFRGTRREAEAKLRELLGPVDDGSFVEKQQITVAESIQDWLQTYVATNTTPCTQRGYEAVMRRYVVPELGRYKLQMLQAGRIDKLYAGMLKRGLSARTVLHTHRVLKQALNHAVTKTKSLKYNPADDTTPPRPDNKPVKMWDAPAIHKFLDAARESPYRDVFHLAVLTGMRRSELLGLRWEIVDLDAGALSVMSTLQRINGKGLVVGLPKTAKSKRSIALSPNAVELLRSVKTTQIERRLAAGPVWEDHGYVFSQANGRPLHPDKVSNEFHKVVQTNALPHLTLHGLRHAHATLMLSAGVHAKVVSERLGHANISVTMDIYSHVMPGMQEAAAQAVDDQLANASS